MCYMSGTCLWIRALLYWELCEHPGKAGPEKHVIHVAISYRGVSVFYIYIKFVVVVVVFESSDSFSGPSMV